VQRQLKAVTDSLRSAQSRLRRLNDKLSDKEWTSRPAPASWSAAECVEHLNLTSKAYLALLPDAVARARKRGGPRKKHYRHDALGWFFSMMFGPLRHVGKFRVLPVKTMSPFGGRVKYSAYSALVIVARHQHRHIEQAEEAAT